PRWSGCGELGEDLRVAGEEGAFVESLAAHPGGDLGVALAGVAASAGGHDVGDGVAAAARDRQYAIALQRAGVPAVGAAAPQRLEIGPVVGGEVVVVAGDAALSSPGCSRSAVSTGGHPCTVG